MARLPKSLFFTLLVGFSLYSPSSHAALTCESLFTRLAAPTPAMELFPNGVFMPGYRAFVDGIQPGARIKLPNGNEFTVHKVLGGGQLTAVLDIGDGWVLRIPAGDGTRKSANELEATKGEFLSGMTSFLSLHDELKAAGARVPELDETRTQAPFGIVVRREHFLFEGPQFIKALQTPDQRMIEPKVLAKARAEFLKLTDQLFLYEEVGDMGVRQIGFNGEEWVLFDFGHTSSSAQHRPLRNFDSERTVLQTWKIDDEDGKFTLRHIPKYLEKEMKKRILKLRQAEMKKGRWYQRPETLYYGLIWGVTPHPLAKGREFEMDASKRFIERDRYGLRPRGQVSTLVIKSLTEEKKGVAVYDVIVNTESRPIAATLYLGIDVSSHERISKMRKKLAKNDLPTLAGPDFLLIYKDVDAATELVPTQQTRDFEPAHRPQYR